MKKILKKFHSRQKGFTLIELLVVIAIIAVLAAIIVPNIGEYIGRGQVAAEQSELALVRNSVAAVMSAGGVGDLSAPPPGVTVTWDTANTISDADDLTISLSSGNYSVSDYFANGLTDIQGTYTVTDEGYVPAP